MSMAILITAYIAFIIFFAVGVCWLWPDFVDYSDPPRIRAVLHWILAVETLVELSIWLGGVVKPWVLVVILVCNGWGLLDAFLRFPVVHDLDSLFSLKQVLLITVKLAGYALGFRNVAKYVGWFILLVLCCVFLLPILWLTALPIGDVTSYHQKHDVVDTDLAVRAWRACCSKPERAAHAARLRVSCKRAVVVLVGVCPCLRSAALRLDPSLARLLRGAPAV